MFGRFFARSGSASDSGQDVEVKTAHADSGFVYTVKGISAAEWLATPFLFSEHAELGALLAQLFEEGYASREGENVLLSWNDIYRLLDDAAYQDSLDLLGLPPKTDLRPALASKGSLSDQDFSIVLSGWLDQKGVPASTPARITGGVITLAGKEFLLPDSTWRLVQNVAHFHQRPADQRTPDSNQRHWAEIRREALAANAHLSDFLHKTIVLTPDQLRLGLRKSDSGELKTVEVSPEFDEAPPRWMELFDRFPTVQDRYEIPDGEGLAHILISPEVKTVLSEIKRMPGRRVSGERAEAFVRNPFALLGPDAVTVVDATAFEAEREQAGLTFQRFLPSIQRDHNGKLASAGLLIEETRQGEIHGEEYIFDSPEMLGKFITKLSERIAREAQCCIWEGYELEILGETPEHLSQLRQIHAEWIAPTITSLTDIYDLSQYSERIEGIGDEKPYYTPFIARKEDDAGWFPDNVLFGFEFSPPGMDAITIPMDTSRVADFAELVRDAREKGRSEITLPDCPHSIPIAEAEILVSTFTAAQKDVSEGKFTPNPPGEVKKVARKHLVVKANIDTVDYNEQRADLLGLSQDAIPRLPSSLRSDIKLKDHQHYGVSWLQHLWRLSPSHCRGALLGDDMGLGKTIQLLCLIASCLEDDPDLDPVLVVAPVALLENWKEEIDKFFVHGALPILTLYGETLAGKRLPKTQLDEQLAQQGITRLLKREWLGNAKVVLTTYETLRDLEFSLAAQHWSLMICDEAQKIKNPNAMVTRAAKKQNVRFRIACTGTPVENTLTDLWCLFDFIQPGLLGSLSEFGKRYRKPIEAESDEEKERVEELRTIIFPQLLRREKKDVARDLPAKIFDSSCRRLPIGSRQRSLYGQAISSFRNSAVSGGTAHLGLLQFLRRLCSDPQIEDRFQADRSSVAEIIEHSPKMAWLMKGLAEIQKKGEKAIVFCEFRDLQRTLQRCIASNFNVHPDIINGDTSAAADHAASRQKRIRAFQEKPGFGVIVLSPLAVGFGVNIQAANHVIHFTRTWNPAKEDQATDRAYRIGQQRDVFVYYPVIVADDFMTFDEKLDKLLDWKRGLSSDMLNGTGEIKISDFLDLPNVDGGPVFSEANDY
jgi:hypothetical protein